MAQEKIMAHDTGVLEALFWKEFKVSSFGGLVHFIGDVRLGSYYNMPV